MSTDDPAALDADPADGDGPEDRDGDAGADAAELAAQVEMLAEENRRLREEYTRARQSQYRRTALGLFGIGLLAAAGALAFPAARDVLLALGATGGFAGLLTYYLTPEQFIAAPVGEAVYRTLAETGAALVAELGLRDDRVYVPVGDAGDPDRRIALFVPQHADYDLPDPDELDSLFVVTDDELRRGIALRPTGDALFDPFEEALAGPLADDPAALADQLADGLVEEFELARGATPEVDPGTGQATVGITGSAYGAVDRFDHPVASFLAAGLAVGLDRPVALDAVAAGDDRADCLVTCSWEVSEGESAVTDTDTSRVGEGGADTDTSRGNEGAGGGDGGGNSDNADRDDDVNDGSDGR